MKIRSMIALLLALCLCVGLAACGSSADKPETTSNETAQSASAEPNTPTNAENTEQASKDEPETQTSVNTEAETDVQTSEEAPAETHADVLVVVFSATGTTKGVAEKIAAIENADLYEIIPAEPYSSADLNWNDSSSRTTKEQNDPSARPEIASEIIDLTGYSTIYIGYPIWWGEEPRIMDTFVESYDFGNITMIPFCTSGGSGIGRSGKNLESNAGSGNWLDGTRHSGSISEDELRTWINGLK